LQKKNLLSKNQ